MMQSGGIHQIELVLLLLLLFVVVFAALARKLQTPYPIVLVIAGLVLSFVPGIPKVSLNPDVVFLVVLPPLLYSAAWVTSWREFKFNLVSILMLAFGLVGFTVVGIAATTKWVFAGFDWRLGFVLGAVVATTDAICRNLHRETHRIAAAHRGYPRGRKPGERCDGVAGTGIRRRDHGERSNANGGCGPIAPGLSHGCGARARPARWRCRSSDSQAHRRQPNRDYADPSWFPTWLTSQRRPFTLRECWRWWLAGCM